MLSSDEIRAPSIPTKLICFELDVPLVGEPGLGLYLGGLVVVYVPYTVRLGIFLIGRCIVRSGVSLGTSVIGSAETEPMRCGHRVCYPVPGYW